MINLILGGVRSGKSRQAEQLATKSNRPVIYIATATAGDEEMRQRIEVHRTQRPSTWTTVEVPFVLAEALQQHAQKECCIIVDCLTLWLTNLLTRGDEARLKAEREALIDLLPKLDRELYLVSNETNSGVIPIDPLSRRFCNESGFLHQEIAKAADRVILMVAGLPQILKGEPL
ncbi:MAG: bifunctional adenosylcobinamide kinase/adenosylcobinamide-phosphate guanylyltransferase [Arenicellales bacterium]|jgi:adenosylcobinamide kinase/adenosylcobinamide-phosphate guanylyltransferase|nr:bifunctional adenosylcobinamide kinase/adenosylcobinamide-phosphate guanylyltransferase [Arenicellales bacterium]MDP7522807.1 bifunctional adenosylcobinamide kinase/adenosylcobinamide-phosphate guanylyltransferase [Arenicellales bacterium]|tara:strand:+ start:72 stop:593 length:522 start_codon:yes stop_codon:yes gene_type:complete